MLHTRMSKQKRLAYTISFKLEVVEYAKEYGNRAAERKFGPPPTEKMIREWRKQEDQLKREDQTKHTFRGNAAKWLELEVDMKDWIVHNWNNGFAVSTKMIIYEAKRIAAEKGFLDFTGSPSWCYRFKRRCGLTKSRSVHKMANDYEFRILSFHQCVIDARKQNYLDVSQIACMDEVLVTFDVPSIETIDLNGVPTVTEKTHYTIVLSCFADGTKLPPMLILKRKNFPKEVIPKGVIVHIHEKGWMDDNGMKVWIEKVWSKRPGWKKPALLVLNQHKAHNSDATEGRFKDANTNLAVVPRGLTSQLQPLEVSINKLFTVLIREEWNKYKAAGNQNLTPTGRIKRVPIAQVCEWVQAALRSVKDETVVWSFKKCGISNALDGTEDHLIYENCEQIEIGDCEGLGFMNSDLMDDESLGFPEN